MSKNYKILYFAEDNSIEAIVHKKFKWEGWMWHPEREKNYHKQDLKRLKRLFKLNESHNFSCGQRSKIEKID